MINFVNWLIVHTAVCSAFKAVWGFDSIRFDLIWFDLIWFDSIWFDLIWFDTRMYVPKVFSINCLLSRRSEKRHTYAVHTKTVQKEFRSNFFFFYNHISLIVLFFIFFKQSRRDLAHSPQVCCVVIKRVDNFSKHHCLKWNYMDP